MSKTVASILETTSAKLTFQDEATQKRFELGVCMAVYGWQNMITAIENQWGGPDSEDKRDWLVGSIVDMFEQNYLEAEDIEIRLLDVMEDEFGAIIEDDSAYPIALMIIKMYQDCVNKEFSEIDRLFMKYQEKLAAKEAQKLHNTNKRISLDSDDEDEAEEDDEDEENEQNDTEMADVAPQLIQGPSEPILDEDGFQLVQKKSKGRRR